MRHKIEYRDYKRRDKKELVRFLSEQIYDHFFEEEKDAKRYSDFILTKSIGTCRYKRVAVVDDKAVGAIFGIRKDGNHFLSFLKQTICSIQLKMKKKNKEALKYLLLLDVMEQELLTQNHVDNKSLIVLFMLEKRYERTGIQDTLLKEWENMVGRQNDMSFYIIVNGRVEPRYLEGYSFQKIDEKSSMVQPKEQRFRFYKTLYRKGVY